MPVAVIAYIPLNTRVYHIVCVSDSMLQNHVRKDGRHQHMYVHKSAGWPFAEQFEPTKAAAVGPTGRVAVSARCQVSALHVIDEQRTHNHTCFTITHVLLLQRHAEISSACIHCWF